MTASIPGSVLIVGAGLAGFQLAATLRRSGYDGEIEILGAEPHRPYDRPPLSKEFLTGTMSAHDLGLDDPGAPLQARWSLGAPAAALDPATLTVRTSTGATHRAEAVVLATGCTPRIPAGMGPAGADSVGGGAAGLPEGAFVLGCLDDAVALRQARVAGARVAVLGGGFIALEAAATAVARQAAEVTLVAPESLPLAGRIGAEAAHALRELHLRHGVRFAPPARVHGLSADAGGRLRAVRLQHADGARAELRADIAICGLGAAPATGWLAGTGLAFDGAGRILCDAAGRTSLPGVWAAGDCANWEPPAPVPAPRPAGGHWQDAVDHATVIGAALLGSGPPALPPPYFWSEQHGVRLQAAGHLISHPRLIAGGIETADLLLVYELDGQETGILGMDRPREVTRWRRSRARRPAVVAA
jgi:NADPH-dependent 2,4-dienoyl-CoA reductase/sulfur reductase-like enzyme